MQESRTSTPTWAYKSVIHQKGSCHPFSVKFLQMQEQDFQRNEVMIERKPTKLRVTLVSSALAVTALAVALTQFAHAKGGKAETKAEPPKVAVDTNPLKRETKLTMSFAPVVKKVAPSVVNVFISSTPK